MSNKIKSFWIGIVAIIAAACSSPVTTPTASPIPTATPPPTATPVPGATLAPHTPIPDPPSLLPTPLTTAGRILLAGWSPDNQWVAYWTFTQETLAQLPSNDGGPYDMMGNLHFYHLGSGQTCESPQLVSFKHPVFAWQENGRAAVLDEDGTVRVAEPCGNDFDILSGLDALIAIRDPTLSTQNTYRVETTEMAYDSERGVQSNVTIITNARTGEESGRVYWDVYLKLGFDNQVFWLTDDLLLIPETKARGPLLVNANGQITEIAAELFGITGNCGGDLCATGMRAVAFSNRETEAYHLAMYWNWYQNFTPPLRTMLYHPETQEIESYGFQEVLGFTSISPANWWMMSRGEAFWARMLDPVGGKLIQFQPGEWPALSSDGRRAAFGTQEGALWVQTLPDRETLGYWDLNLPERPGYWSLGWAPDAERVAVIPHWYDDEQKSALYLLDCCNGAPTDLIPTLTPTPTQSPGPTAEASPIPSVDLARGTLLTFFNLLHLRRYEEAIPLYGGDYEIMQTWNPDVDPNDAVALWTNACESNGLRCLPVLNIVNQLKISPTEFHFLVEFMWDDGSLFVRGPCCGATEEEMPPVSQFEYTVVLGLDGKYRVMGWPVHVP